MEYLTVDEAAAVLKLSKYTVRELLKSKKLHGVKIAGGRQWRIQRDELERYLRGDHDEPGGANDDR